MTADRDRAYCSMYAENGFNIQVNIGKNCSVAFPRTETRDSWMHYYHAAFDILNLKF